MEGMQGMEGMQHAAPTPPTTQQEQQSKPPQAGEQQPGQEMEEHAWNGGHAACSWGAK